MPIDVVVCMVILVVVALVAVAALAAIFSKKAVRRKAAMGVLDRLLSALVELLRGRAV
ncbi:hypothetical protein [Microbispora sp. H10830]|uniref:hypothetical protein n=1 Tax=Microbispora sp. H10830 TaxID=2729109 RepID=UPI001602F3DA|nr:hypothetical protein [Microbispora sp. H10830]